MATDQSPTTPESYGYKRLAEFMAWDPQAAIVHRFRATNVLNILILQADICRLQEELFKLTQSYKDLNEQQKQYHFDWSTLEALSDESNVEMRNKVLDLRKCLKEYSM